MQKIDLKPISINEAYTGQRFKTKEYRQFAKALTFMIKKVKLPPPPYRINVIWGLSNMGADFDNPLKPSQDVIAKKFGINDKLIYKGEIEKVEVPKGEEFIMFEILHHEPTIYKDGKLHRQ